MFRVPTNKTSGLNRANASVRSFSELNAGEAAKLNKTEPLLVKADG